MITKSDFSGDKTLVDKKIEQFCKSSAELLQSIHARCGSIADTLIPRKARTAGEKALREMIPVPDPDMTVDFLEEV